MQALPKDNEGTTPLYVEEFIDSFGNRCSQICCACGSDSPERDRTSLNAREMPDPQGFGLQLTPVEDLPPEVLSFSRRAVTARSIAW